MAVSADGFVPSRCEERDQVWHTMDILRRLWEESLPRGSWPRLETAEEAGESAHIKSVERQTGA